MSPGAFYRECRGLNLRPEMVKKIPDPSPWKVKLEQGAGAETWRDAERSH